MFKAKNKVRMHDTDMAGILYFPRIYRFAHDALEDFISSLGFKFHTIFEEGHFIFVIVHSEADYYVPLRVGDDVEVHLAVEKTGQTSFTLAYEIFRSDQTHMGSVKTVHVCIDKKKFSKIPIPQPLKEALSRHLLS